MDRGPTPSLAGGPRQSRSSRWVASGREICPGHLTLLPGSPSSQLPQCPPPPLPGPNPTHPSRSSSKPPRENTPLGPEGSSQVRDCHTSPISQHLVGQNTWLLSGG